MSSSYQTTVAGSEANGVPTGSPSSCNSWDPSSLPKASASAELLNLFRLAGSSGMHWFSRTFRPEPDIESASTADQDQASTSIGPKVFIIAGPLGTTSSKDTIHEFAEAFRSRGADVGLFGDGEHPQSVETLDNAFSQFMTNPRDDATIILICHGTSNQDSHSISLGKEWTPTADVLQRICPTTEDCGKRHVFFLSCHSGSALKSIKYLPEGSHGVSLANDNESLVPGWSAFTDGIRKGTDPLTADGLLDTYLLHGLENHSTVASHVSGTRTISHSISLQNRIQSGRGYRQQELASIDSQLDPDVTRPLMSNISSGSAYEPAVSEYGMCLRIEKAAIKYMYPDL